MGTLICIPMAARLAVWSRSVKEASRSGSSAARACADRDCACFSASPESWILVLPSGDTATSTARFKLNWIGPAAEATCAAHNIQTNFIYFSSLPATRARKPAPKNATSR
jgi:hypothetical protein